MAKKILLIDFDTAVGIAQKGKPTSVRPGAAEALAELTKNNYDVQIFSRTVSVEEVEQFLKDNNVPFSKVVELGHFDIIISDDAIAASSRWEWTLESIVLHKPAKQKDTKEEMHDAMQRYKTLAKKQEKIDCVCCG